ncbi:MATE family efflux transporter [Sansalvadorimonas sp. 2012CJ34-2]|uniref:MATE family efflux transporter n=1 Tax=Parendozoicomonas callyspongiae TaxID=2942213 RepID=A0ABT0PI01_9GAMM|nr:MATE family efflux transporter [Sansalvadorimonas sp. 2012CJ34-2]MCL6271022.1 MATE family efflux transporter [Sansalvadorimonas sp. 2012CJ34-2]
MLSSNRQVWQFALPVIVSNITVPLLGLVDSAVLGRLPSPIYLGAVAVGASLFSFIFWAFGFLRMGTTGQVSRAYGRGDGQSLRDILVQSLAISAILGVLLILLAELILHTALPFFKPGPDVVPEVGNYFLTRIWSAPATLANYAVLGWLLGRQVARAPLILLMFQNAINIALNLFFVIGLGMAVKGVALATVVAEYASLLLGLVLCSRYLKSIDGFMRLKEALHLSKISSLMTVNRQLFVRNLCLLFTMSMFTAWGARQGDIILAANALLVNFVMLTANALDGFAFAAEALIGKATGENNPRVVRGVLKSTLQCSVIMSLGLSLCYWLFGEPVLFWLTDIEGLAATALIYLPWLVVMPVLGVLCFWLDGVFIGLGKTALMQQIMMLSTFAVFVPVWYLTRSAGNHGLWFAFSLFTLARSSGMFMAFLPAYKRIRAECTKD